MDSRWEVFLESILSDTHPDDIDIISRVDKYLAACCTGSGVSGLPQPISREDVLLYQLAEKIASGGFAKPEQEKTVEITENGTTAVTPDEGKVLSKVTANVNVETPPPNLQEKTFAISAAGKGGVVTPDDEFDGLSQVTVSDISLETKTITENGTFTPTEGSFFSEVTVNVEQQKSGASLAEFLGGEMTELTAADLAGVTKIKDGACQYYYSLTSLEIPDECTSIGTAAFNWCTKIKTATVGKGVTAIPVNCFSECRSITNLTLLGESITEIKDLAFSNTGADAETGFALSIMTATPPTLGSDVFKGANITSIIVPVGSGDTYKAAVGWTDYTDKISENVEG